MHKREILSKKWDLGTWGSCACNMLMIFLCFWPQFSLHQKGKDTTIYLWVTFGLSINFNKSSIYSLGQHA